MEPQVAEVEMVPKEYKKLEELTPKSAEAMEVLEDHDDVQKVSANSTREADMAAA